MLEKQILLLKKDGRNIVEIVKKNVAINGLYMMLLINMVQKILRQKKLNIQKIILNYQKEKFIG